jgi:hypothetical protein
MRAFAGRLARSSDAEIVWDASQLRGSKRCSRFRSTPMNGPTSCTTLPVTAAGTGF